MMGKLKIGELAGAAGVGVETVRYYERRGLLAEPARTPSGYRAYEHDSVIRLRFICRAKELGFTLREIEELLTLRHQPGHTCAEVSELAREKCRDLESKIRDLRRILGALRGVAEVCGGRGPASAEECPVLAALEDDRSAAEDRDAHP